MGLQTELSIDGSWNFQIFASSWIFSTALNFQEIFAQEALTVLLNPVLLNLVLPEPTPIRKETSTKLTAWIVNQGNIAKEEETFSQLVNSLSA